MKKFILLAFAIISGYFSYSRDVDSVVVSPVTVCQLDSVFIKIHYSGFSADSLVASLSSSSGNYIPLNNIYGDKLSGTGYLTFWFVINSGISSGTYRIFVKDSIFSIFPTDTSNFFTVNAKATVNVGGSAGSICAGATTSALGGSFGGSATGAVWSDGGAGGSFNNNGGSTPNTTTYTAASPSPTTVTLTLTSSGGSCGVATANKTLTVNANPTVSAGSALSPVCQGATTAALGGSFGGSATSAVWSDGGAGGSFNNNGGATPGTATYIAPTGTFGPVTLTLTTSGGSCGTTSANKSLTVNQGATVNVGSAPADICQGGSTAALGGAFGGSATGAVWSDGGAGGSFTNNSGSTPNTTVYTASASSSSPVTLTLTSTGGSCGSAFNGKQLIVNATATANAGAPVAAICQGGTSAPLGGSVGGAATGGTWSDGGVGGNFNPNVNNFNATWKPPSNYTGTATLTLTSTGGSCGTANDSKTIKVNPAPTASLTLSPSTICLGNNTTLSITVTNAVGNLTTYAIGTSPGATDITGTTTIVSSGTFTTNKVVTPPLGVTNYYLTAITAPCGSVSSNDNVLVIPTTSGGVLSQGTVVCPGTTNNTTFTLTGHVGNIVKWQMSVDEGNNWTDISNTTTTHTATNILVSTLFRVVCQSGSCSSVNSTTAGVFVNKDPVANFTADAVCLGLTTSFINTSTPGTSINPAQQISYNIPGVVTSSSTYSWDFGDAGSSSDTSNVQNPTYPYPGQGSFNARLTVTTNTTIGSINTSCSNTKIISVSVVPKPLPPVASTKNPATICFMQLGVNFSIDTVSGISYQWRAVNPSVTIHGQYTSSVLIDFPSTGSPFDIYIIASSAGGCKDSLRISINASTTVANSPQLILTNNNKTLVCLDNQQGSYQWGYDDKTTFRGTDITGASLQDFTPTGGFDFTTKNYYVKLSSGGCTYKVYYNAPAGFNQSHEKINYSLYPNPNNGNFILELGMENKSMNAYVVDLLGRNVKLLKLEPGSNAINIQSLSSGIYYLQFMNEQGAKESIKLIINN